jgi:galactokinase
VAAAQLEAAEMPALAKRRARHVLGENGRVFAAVEALRSGDARVLGGLMTESHRSSMENFENSIPELDVLVELAVAQRGCLGARLTGGGFGGAIVALVELDGAEAVLDAVAAGYRERTGNLAKGYLCRAWDGALPPGQGD